MYSLNIISPEASLQRRLYLLRKMSTHRLSEAPDKRFFLCSLSTRTVVYKGQCNPCQLWLYYDDLTQEDFATHVCIVHTRFSTNTFPSWERAHPNRCEKQRCLND